MTCNLLMEAESVLFCSQHILDLIDKGCQGGPWSENVKDAVKTVLNVLLRNSIRNPNGEDAIRINQIAGMPTNDAGIVFMQGIIRNWVPVISHVINARAGCYESCVRIYTEGTEDILPDLFDEFNVKIGGSKDITEIFQSLDCFFIGVESCMVTPFYENELVRIALFKGKSIQSAVINRDETGEKTISVQIKGREGIPFKFMQLCERPKD